MSTKKYLDNSGLTYFWGKVNNKLGDKVDKITGKQLSTEDYTTTEKTKLSGIETGAEVNVIENIEVNGVTGTISGKTASVTVPTGAGTIDSISVNGTPQTIDANKNVDITIPTFYVEVNDSQHPFELLDQVPGLYVFPSGSITTHLDTTYKPSVSVLGNQILVHGAKTSTVTDGDPIYSFISVNGRGTTMSYDSSKTTHQSSTQDTERIATLSTAQTITGVKTFSALPESSVAPTTDDQLANKKYVDDSVSGKLDTSAVKTTNTTSNSDTYSCTYINGELSYLNTYCGTLDNELGTKLDKSAAYPVGSIYISGNATSPASLFGGTWTQLKNRYLFATNSTSGAKGKDAQSSNTGTNTASHTLTVNQIPSHSHGYSGYYGVSRTSRDVDCVTWGDIGDRGEGTLSTGGGQGHSHGMSYIEIYVWQRTA